MQLASRSLGDIEQHFGMRIAWHEPDDIDRQSHLLNQYFDPPRILYVTFDI